MNNFYRIISVLFFFNFYLNGFFSACKASEEVYLAVPQSLSLSEAAQEALKQSPEVLQAEAETQIASWGRLEALAAHLPQLSANGEHFLAANYMNMGILFGGAQVTFPTAYPQTSVSLDVSLLLFDGFSSINRYKASVLENEGAQLRLLRARFQVEKEVQFRFYQALASQTLLDVADENIKSLTEHLSLAQAMDRTGYSTRFDVLRIEAQLEEAQAERLLAADNTILARRSLSRSLGMTDDTRPLLGKLPIPSSSSVNPGLSLQVSERTDLEAVQKHEEALEKISRAASAFWSPKISLFAQELFYRFGDFNPVIVPNTSFQNASSVGLRLTWSIFDGGASLARANKVYAQELKDQQAVRGALLNAPEDFETWKRRFFYNVSLYHARKKTVAKSEESVRLAKLGLKAGTRTSTEWLDAELELFRARAGLVRAQSDTTEALIRLELAVGKSLQAHDGE